LKVSISPPFRSDTNISAIKYRSSHVAHPIFAPKTASVWGLGTQKHKPATRFILSRSLNQIPRVFHLHPKYTVLNFQ
jgi:hypothetical protein